jgi:hypothetical protein
LLHTNLCFVFLLGRRVCFKLNTVLSKEERERERERESWGVKPT